MSRWASFAIFAGIREWCGYLALISGREYPEWWETAFLGDVYGGANCVLPASLSHFGCCQGIVPRRGVIIDYP